MSLDLVTLASADSVKCCGCGTIIHRGDGFFKLFHGPDDATMYLCLAPCGFEIAREVIEFAKSRQK